MSSGFVSGGTIDAPIERSDEWLAAQQEIEANRARKAEEARRQNGKSLFETLEANKAAKEEAFAEANKLKNQFRSLDQDEIEFLDSVLESTRVEEERIKKETREGLAVFRERQEEEDRKAREAVSGAVEEEGAVGGDVGEGLSFGVGKGKKRKRGKEGLKGVKRRESSGAEAQKKRVGDTEDPSSVVKTTTSKNVEGTAEEIRIEKGVHDFMQNSTIPVVDKKLAALLRTPTKPAAKGGLVDYGSDDDDW